LDNLLKAGIQNGRRAERIELETLEAYAGTAIHAIATTAEAEEGSGEEAVAPRRIGISLGPQYGTVGGQFVKAAAREAMQAGSADEPGSRIDLLCVLGFAFDPNVIGTAVEGAEVATDLDETDIGEGGFASVARRKL